MVNLGDTVKCAGEEDLTLICTRIQDLNNSTMASKDTTTRAAAGADITKVATWVDQATTMTETTHSQEEVEVSKEAHQ